MLTMRETEPGLHAIDDSRDTGRRRKQINAARAQIKRKAHASAQRMLRELANTEPPCCESVRLLATIYTATGRKVEARALLSESARMIDEALGTIDYAALRLDWSSDGAREALRLWIACARALNDAQRANEALRLIERCVHTDPLDHVCARMELITTLVETERADEATGYAVHFADETHPGVLYTMVIAHSMTEQSEKKSAAAQWARKAIECAPDIAAWIARGAPERKTMRSGRHLENQAKARTGHLWRNEATATACAIVREAYEEWNMRDHATDKAREHTRGLGVLAALLGLHAWAEQEQTPRTAQAQK